MKKTYSKPTLEVVRVQTQALMAGSPVLGGEYGGGTVLAPEFEEIVEE